MNGNKISIAVICGPTGVGKTELSLRLARETGAEIVSADSMQIYKGMNVGTAKPTQEEMRSVRHHMVDIVTPFENYSVSRYVTDAKKCIDDIAARGKGVILVGGTGLYIDSLISGNSFDSPGASVEVRKKYNDMFDVMGGRAMIERLAEFDRVGAERLNPNDKKRVVRAFEVYELSGKPMSFWDEQSRLKESRYNAVFIGLRTNSRTVLYDRINRRVDKMFENGLVEETKNLMDEGVPPSATAMQAIGYKEIVSALLENRDIEAAKDMIKQSSRRYAKRQLTWFRRNTAINWFDTDTTTPDEIFDNTVYLTKFAL